MCALLRLFRARTSGWALSIELVSAIVGTACASASVTLAKFPSDDLDDCERRDQQRAMMVRRPMRLGAGLPAFSVLTHSLVDLLAIAPIFR
jgi:hypothetical protein